MKPWAQRIHDRLAELRPEKSQAGLARACKISAPSVSQWFSDGPKVTNMIGGDNLLQAASYLGVSPDWIMFGKARPAPSQAVKLDPETLSDAQRLLHAFIGIMGLAPEAMSDPYLLSDAYEIAAAEGQEQSDLLGGTQRLAAKIRAREGGGDNGDNRGADKATGDKNGDARQAGGWGAASAKAGKRP